MNVTYYDAVCFVPKTNVYFHGFGVMANYNGKDLTYKIKWSIDDETSEEYEVSKVDSEKEYLYKSSGNVYRVKSYLNGFKDLFDKLTPIDMIEGLVMKRRNARLEMGTSELNNVRSQIKCRKSSKNYKY